MGCGASIQHRTSFDNPVTKDDADDECIPRIAGVIAKVSDTRPRRDEFTPFNEQIYSILTAWCEQTGQKFVDPEFFPQDKSLYTHIEKRSDSSDVVWLRPGVSRITLYKCLYIHVYIM